MAVVSHPQIDALEFDALMARTGWRAPIERLSGEVVVIPPIGGRASATSLTLSYALQSWQRHTGYGGLLLADVVLMAGDERPVPDLSWWARARRPEVTDGGIASVPDLVVEVLSPRSRDNDLRVKPEVYERIGVREYWRVDPRDEVVMVGRRTSGALVDLPVLVGDDRLTSPLLEGFDVAVGQLFATR